MNEVAMVVGYALLVLVGMGSVWIAVVLAIAFLRDVRNYPRARDLQRRIDAMGKHCAELMNERDALRAEVEMLRSTTPYRGPTMEER